LNHDVEFDSRVSCIYYLHFNEIYVILYGLMLIWYCL